MADAGNRMKALVKDDGGVRIAQVTRPTIARDGDLLIQVARAGLCRTDLYVAQGLLASKNPVILGHEFSGLVAEVGSGVLGFCRGDRVAVMPILPCNSCKECLAGRRASCLNCSMLGVDLDGAFAEFITVPAQSVYHLPAQLSFRAGAYAEPVAASLAVLKAGILPQQRGVIYGSGRIAQLTERVLLAHGFKDIFCWDPYCHCAALEADSYDFLVETVAGDLPLTDMITALVPHGKLLLKSRAFKPAGIDLRQALKKEISFHAVNYGSFAAAVELLASGKLQVEDLLGAARPLEDFAAVFEQARHTEQLKTFFYMDQAYVRDI